MQKIVIVTSGHPPFDERIFYKFGLSFIKKHFDVSIICSTKSINIINENIQISGFNGDNINKREKISKLTAEINRFSPDIIICCEPLTILAAKKYCQSVKKKVTICYDITEWYPENVAFKLNGIKRLITYCFLYLFNIYTSNLADILILGEELKKKRYELFAPSKYFLQIEYYPVLKHFQYSEPVFDGKNLTLVYSGLITIERGILNILEVASLLAKRNTDINISLKILGKFISKDEENIIRDRIYCIPQANITIHDWVDYTEFSKNISDADICLDLRENNFIFNNSLPIKLFDYLACGKPVIYSNINAIRKEINIEEFGYLVNQHDYKGISEIIESYIKSPAKLKLHSQNARSYAEQVYNWEKVEDKLMRLITY